MNFRRSSGFSLIEMMLAMLIGLIIMAGVMSLYVSTRDTQRSSDDQLALLADARFAMETIAYDLRHTGIWGRHNMGELLACQKAGANSIACPDGYDMPAATADCADREYINIARPLFAANNSNPYASTCASDSYKTGTDVLTIRYADTMKLTGLADGMVYVRSNIRSGMIFEATETTDADGNTVSASYPDADFYKWDDSEATSNHLLVSRVYYVSDYSDVAGDGIPSLRRGDLGVGPAMSSEVLLSGVEDFQLEFGVDVAVDGVSSSKGDGQVDAYVNASNVTDWGNGEVIAVRMWVLMRTLREDRDNIGGDQTFTIAGAAPVTFSDGYRRYLVSSVVKLRNTFQLDKMQAGG